MQAISYIEPISAYIPAMATGRPPRVPRTALGKKIYQAREQAGLSQEQLAQRIGVTQRVIAYWEREAVSLRAEQIDALANALNLTTDALLGRKQPTPKTGPAGKVRQVFERVSSLPWHQQRQIVTIVEDLLTARDVKAQKAT
jgi:transcriptional regulator with XRE-family HTH domain